MSPKAIVLHANWLRYQALNPFKQLTDSVNKIIANNPESKLYIVGNVPQWYSDLPHILVARNIHVDKIRYLTPSQFLTLGAIDAEIQSASQNSSIEFISALDKFCEETRCAAVIHHRDDHIPISNDYGHMSEAGSSWLVEQILQEIEISERKN